MALSLAAFFPLSPAISSLGLRSLPRKATNYHSHAMISPLEPSSCNDVSTYSEVITWHFVWVKLTLKMNDKSHAILHSKMCHEALRLFIYYKISLSLKLIEVTKKFSGIKGSSRFRPMILMRSLNKSLIKWKFNVVKHWACLHSYRMPNPHTDWLLRIKGECSRCTAEVRTSVKEIRAIKQTSMLGIAVGSGTSNMTTQPLVIYIRFRTHPNELHQPSWKQIIGSGCARSGCPATTNWFVKCRWTVSSESAPDVAWPWLVSMLLGRHRFPITVNLETMN